jgi:prepilin-type N-terminal cleavage/methylation domain-containing protein
MRSLRSAKGFTLIELLIVVVIIGILATVLISRFTGVKDSAYVAHINTCAERIKTASQAFAAANPAGTAATGYADCAKMDPDLWENANADGLTITWGATTTITHSKIKTAGIQATVNLSTGVVVAASLTQ